MISHPPNPTLFPYTTLFRSLALERAHLGPQPQSVAGRLVGDMVRPSAPEVSAAFVMPDLFTHFAVIAAIEIQVRLIHEHHGDRKSTRLNSSHRCSSYAVFCL